MQHILPEELPRLSHFLSAARVSAPGDIAPNVCPHSLDSPYHSFQSAILYFIPMCCKEMTSHGFYQWLHEKAKVFCLLIKKYFPTVYYYQCSTLRIGLLKSASNYHQLPEEWPFSYFASLYHKKKLEQIIVCLCLQNMSSKYPRICYESEVLF